LKAFELIAVLRRPGAHELFVKFGVLVHGSLFWRISWNKLDKPVKPRLSCCSLEDESC
jgi:hypothetical protein